MPEQARSAERPSELASDLTTLLGDLGLAINLPPLQYAPRDRTEFLPLLLSTAADHWASSDSAFLAYEACTSHNYGAYF